METVFDALRIHRRRADSGFHHWRLQDLFPCAPLIESRGFQRERCGREPAPISIGGIAGFDPIHAFRADARPERFKVFTGAKFAERRIELPGGVAIKKGKARRLLLLPVVRERGN